MSGMQERLEEANRELRGNHAWPALELDPKQTVIYRMAEHIVREYQAWQEHDYSDEMNALHADTKSLLKLSVVDCYDEQVTEVRFSIPFVEGQGDGRT